ASVRPTTRGTLAQRHRRRRIGRGCPDPGRDVLGRAAQTACGITSGGPARVTSGTGIAPFVPCGSHGKERRARFVSEGGSEWCTGPRFEPLGADRVICGSARHWGG